MTADAGKREITIPKIFAVPLIEQLSIVRGKLGGTFALPVSSGNGTARDALTWWNGQKTEDQPVIHAALEALASPVLVIDCVIVRNNRTLLSSRLAILSLKPEDPVFLIGTDTAGRDFRIEYLRHRDTFINTLLLLLAGTSPVLSDSMLTFAIPRHDLPVLLGIVDLRRRQKYQSLVTHGAVPVTMNFGEIEQSTKDGIATTDPRWILPFAASIAPVKFTPPQPQEIRKSLTDLVTKGLVRQDSSPGSYDVTEAGQMLADAWGEQVTWIGFSLVGVRDDGRFVTECAMAIRSEASLWFVDLGGKGPVPVGVTTVNFTRMRNIIETLFSPAGIAQIPDTAAVQVSGLREVPLTKTPSPSRPVTFQPQNSGQQGGAFCPKCGSPVITGRKFCGDCGASLNGQ
jgi:hypothetical protein